MKRKDSERSESKCRHQNESWEKEQKEQVRESVKEKQVIEYLEPDTSHLLSHLTLSMPFQGRYYCTHFTESKMKV